MNQLSNKTAAAVPTNCLFAAPRRDWLTTRAADVPDAPADHRSGRLGTTDNIHPTNSTRRPRSKGPTMDYPACHPRRRWREIIQPWTPSEDFTQGEKTTQGGGWRSSAPTPAEYEHCPNPPDGPTRGQTRMGQNPLPLRRAGSSTANGNLSDPPRRISEK